MKHYKHLTQEQRYQISSLLQTSASQNKIARIIGVSPSTISREIKCNTGLKGYRPKQAQRLSRQRKANNSKRITPFAWRYIETLLARKHSPEQITTRLRLMGWEGVPSHERIYQYIYADKRKVGKGYKGVLVILVGHATRQTKTQALKKSPSRAGIRCLYQPVESRAPAQYHL